jgi:hypothetical protein
MSQLLMRQVHLDFHTNGTIPDVGAEWDAQSFVETLKRAHVNSINLFGRCHHGYVYYLPTRFTAHPALKVNLLGQQIEACHRAGIRAPIYITVGWDELSAARHPEWQQVTPQGVLGEWGPMIARWKKMCLNSPYLDYVWEQTTEVLDLFGEEVDGFWFDIILQGECVCQSCLADMRRQGLDPDSAGDRQRLAQQAIDKYRRRFGDGVRARKPDILVFHNSGHISPTVRPTLDTFTHLELESLPSTGYWGYNHYPITARYARTLGKPTLGMTGKFHTAWGDFSSFKNLPALEYECFQMLANGAACCIGDQMHPRGRLSEPAYELIGQVYASVEAKEPWCVGAEPLTEIAVYNTEAVGTHDGSVDTSNTGAMRMLSEAHQQFDFVDGDADWSRYRLLVLPDKVPLDEHLAAKLRGWLVAGGKVIASYKSGLRPDGSDFALSEFGLRCLGPAPNLPDYAWPRPELGGSLANTEYTMYEQGMAVELRDGTQILADTYAPYFNRTWQHFCSHRQTPMDPQRLAGYPSVTLNQAGNVAYLAHPVFYGYRRQAVLWFKRMLLALLGHLLPDPLVQCGAPSTAQVTLLQQRERRIAHLLHYIPERRGIEFDTIEEVIPLYNVPLAFKMPYRPTRVYTVPSLEALSSDYEGGYLRTVVPVVMGHQMVVAE